MFLPTIMPDFAGGSSPTNVCDIACTLLTDWGTGEDEEVFTV